MSSSRNAAIGIGGSSRRSRERQAGNGQREIQHRGVDAPSRTTSTIIAIDARRHARDRTSVPAACGAPPSTGAVPMRGLGGAGHRAAASRSSRRCGVTRVAARAAWHVGRGAAHRQRRADRPRRRDQRRVVRRCSSAAETAATRLWPAPRSDAGGAPRLGARWLGRDPWRQSRRGRERRAASLRPPSPLVPARRRSGDRDRAPACARDCASGAGPSSKSASGTPSPSLLQAAARAPARPATTARSRSRNSGSGRSSRIRDSRTWGTSFGRVTWRGDAGASGAAVQRRPRPAARAGSARGARRPRRAADRRSGCDRARSKRVVQAAGGEQRAAARQNGFAGRRHRQRSRRARPARRSRPAPMRP